MSENTGCLRRVSLWRELSTAASIALFLAVGTTGVMLLLGVRGMALKGIHEWIGLAFVVAAVLHTCRHWTAFLNYFRKGSAWCVFILASVAVGVFTMPAILGDDSHGPRGGGPGAMMPAPELLDANHDGRVTHEEFYAAWDNLNQEQFNRMDADADSVLSTEELAKAQRPGPPPGAGDRGRRQE